MGFKIGAKSSILTHFIVSERGNLEVGNHTVINNNCRFDNRFPIQIGNNVSITYGTSILTKGHDIDDPNFRTKGAPVVVADYVWIAAYAIILPGVTLGKGCAVLPGSVVNKNVEPFQVVGGNPAVVIRERTHNLNYKLFWDPWVPFWG
jgi:acetyltransferase-like isoleucine patch superfamily enzyme